MNDQYDLSIDNIMQEVEEPDVLFSNPSLLTHPNIPKPLHSLAPRTLMPIKEWDEIRRAAYAKNNYHCWACGTYRNYDTHRMRFDDVSGESLDCHETYDIDYENKTSTIKEFTALCKNCHGYIHSGRMNALYGKGVFDEEDCWLFTTHGDSILIDGGLTPYREVDRRDYREDWGEWRLIYNGKEFKSNFPTYEAWKNHYA